MVVLSDHLSNHGDAWHDLAARTKIALQQPRDARRPAPTRQVQRRLSPAEQVAVARRYQQGALVKELAAEFGTHRTTISECLRRLAVPLRKRTKDSHTKDEATQIVARS